MQRKLSFTLVLLLLIGLSVWALDRWSILPLWPIDPVDCLPAEATVVWSLPEMDLALGFTARTDQPGWQHAVKQLPGLTKDIDLINSLIDTLFPSRTLIDRTRGLLSISALDEQQLGGTWILDLRSLGKLQPEDWLISHGIAHESSSFRGNPVWTVTLPEGDQISIGAIRNLLILARRAYQIEAVLAADLHGTNWMKDLNSATDPAAIFSLYWNTSNWEDIQRNLFTAGGQQLTQNWKSWFYSARFDLIAADGGYRIEGKALAFDQWLSTRNSPALVESDLWGLLPNNTAAIKAINLSDYSNYFRQGSRQQIGRFQRFFLPWMTGPVLELTLRPFNAQVQDRQIYFLAFQDRSMVTAALNDWMEEVGILQTTNYQGFELTQVQEDQNLFPLTEDFGNNPWWTMVGDYLVLATNRSALENWIDQYVVGNALPLTEVARQMTLSETGGQFSFFLDWKQWRTGWRHIVKDDALANALAELGQLTLRVKSKGDAAEIDGLWKIEQEIQQEGDLNWRVVLGDEVTAGPWLCRDAQGEPLIAAQDQDHRLYVLNGAGKNIWQQQLDAPILSQVRTIALKEGLAFCFNTGDKIHLMDLAGNAIAPFPLKLNNPTTLAVTVIDFSEDKNYTFFIVASDGCVYGYDLEGGPVPAWNPKCQLGEIAHPLLHFQDENRDFLVLQNTNGTLRAFARDGSLRLETDFPADQQTAIPQVQLLNGPKQIVSCTDSGLLEVLTLDGAAIQFRLPVGYNRGVKMLYVDLLGDSRKDYLLASERTLNLHVYTKDGLKKEFEKAFPNAIDRFFVLYPPTSDEPYIGVLLQGKQRIYLLNRQGEVEKGFPLAGSTPFFIADLFHTGERHLIVGYQDELLAYRLP